jgi:hypothetical protein
MAESTLSAATRAELARDDADAIGESEQADQPPNVAYIEPHADRFFDRSAPAAQMADLRLRAGPAAVEAATVQTGELARFLNAVAGGVGTSLAGSAYGEHEPKADLMRQAHGYVETVWTALSEFATRPTEGGGDVIVIDQPGARLRPLSGPDARESAVFLMASIISREPAMIAVTYGSLAATYRDGGAPIASYADLVAGWPELVSDVVQLRHVGACVPSARFFDFDNAEPWRTVKEAVRQLVQCDVRYGELSHSFTATLERLDPKVALAIDAAWGAVRAFPFCAKLGKERLMRDEATYAQFAALCAVKMLYASNALAGRQYAGPANVRALQEEMQRLVNKFQFGLARDGPGRLHWRY